MKKLMFGLVAAAACTAMAEITSANVVGYQQYDLVQGYNFYSPVFEAVSGTMNLQDLQLINAAGDGTENIVLIDNDGMTQGQYSWFSDEQTGEGKDGWFDMDAWAFYDVDIENGQGFYIYTKKMGVKIQSSGAVKLEPYSKTLKMGYNIVGNCSPVAINIQDVKLVDAKGDGTESIISIDSEGMTQGQFSWFSDEQTGEGKDGWFDMDAWDFYDFEIAAGEGLYVYAKKDGVKLTIPSAITK